MAVLRSAPRIFSAPTSSLLDNDCSWRPSFVCVPYDSYIGDLKEVMLAAREYLEVGGVLGFTCELTKVVDCDETKVKNAPLQINGHRLLWGLP